VPDGEKPPVPRGGVAVIVDHDDPSPPQNIYSVTTLTPSQLAIVRARIKRERERLRKGRSKSDFDRAVFWTYKIFGFDVHLDSDFVPLPTFGASFESFVDFVYAKERDAEAEEVVEDEEGPPTG